MKTRSNSIFNIFTLVALLAMFVSLLPTSPAKAESLTSPLQANGDFLWARSMGGTSTDSGRSIALDSSGNVYTTGFFEGTVDFDPGAGTTNLISAGSWDIFVFKLDSSGNFLWAKSMGGMSYDYSSGIALDSSDNVYITGNFEGTADFDPSTGTSDLVSVGSDDIFVSKLDNNGNFVWAKSIGGTSYDEGFGIAVDSNSNVYTIGSFQGIIDFYPGAGTSTLTSAGGSDIFISKLDSSGNFLWAKSIGGGSSDYGYGIAVDSNSNVYTTGFFAGTTDFDPGAGTFNLASVGESDIFISKLDSSGNFLWAKSIGGGSTDFGYGIAVDSNSNVYTTGFFAGTTDFDPSTDTYNLASAGNFDIFASKLDSNGNFLWAKRIGGADYDSGQGITLDSKGNVYMTGYYLGAIDFDPGVGTFNLTSVGQEDIFVSKLDSSGTFAWAKSMGAESDDVGRDIALDANSNVYITGYFNGTVDFDPGVGTSNLTSVGSHDIFISKLGSDGVTPTITSFIATSPCSSFNIPIAVFTASDAVGVTGYIITTSSITPAADNLGWSGTAPAIYTVSTDGNYTLYPWAKNATGNVSSVFSSPVSVTVDTTAPTVVSSLRVNANPTAATSVDFTVTFSESVTGVNTGDFNLITSGVSGATVSGVGGSGTTYTVTVNTGSGNGTIRLDMLDDDTIVDAALNPLAAGFTSGQTYDIEKTAPTVVSSLRVNANPTNLASVDFTVTFSESVIGVNTGDFNLITSGISGAAVSGVSGSGNTYTVTVSTGSGNGTLRLDVLDDDTIVDAVLNPLAAGFTSGEIYTIIKSATFGDVPLDYWASSYIERLYNAGITGGCSVTPLNYCPDSTVTRAQMAVFLLKGMHGSS